jgi:hypothetical protein
VYSNYTPRHLKREACICKAGSAVGRELIAHNVARKRKFVLKHLERVLVFAGVSPVAATLHVSSYGPGRRSGRNLVVSIGRSREIDSAVRS